MRKIRRVNKLVGSGRVFEYPGGYKAIINRTETHFLGELTNKTGMTIGRKEHPIASGQNEEWVANKMYAQQLKADIARRSAR